jgi:2-dehydro-3-deoxygluconokinase
MSTAPRHERSERGEPAGAPPGPAPGSVACLGEALVLLPFLPPDGAALPGVERGTLAGAEANVAIGLAGMGVPVACVTRVGTDPYGEFLHAELRRRRVDVRAVQFDPVRPTGVYAKRTITDASGQPRSEMLYRRAGSAASAMSPAFLDDPAAKDVLGRARLIHTSGITAALSRSCAELMDAILRRPRRFDATVCFDVNWREQLWPSGDPSLIIQLSGLADTVLVGGDEALRVFGTDDPQRIRTLLPDPEWIIIKDGARRALAIGADGSLIDQPALLVDVVEPVGAGDAFAAGFLAGVVRGEDTGRCLRRGHVSAAAVLTVRGDSAPLPPDSVVESLLASSAAAWRATKVSVDGFQLPGGDA